MQDEDGPRKLECFIIMPITTPSQFSASYRDGAEHFEHVLEYLFIPALKKAGFESIRPQTTGADVIHANIIRNLAQSDLVLCDMSALNPNVFFELGIRSALDKPVCMVVDDVTSNIPFDTGIINYQTYKSTLDHWEMEGEIERLSSHIKASATKSNGRNSLWLYFGVGSRGSFSVSNTSTDAKIDLLNLQLQAVLERRAEIGSKQASSSKDDDRSFVRELFRAAEKLGIKPTGGLAGPRKRITMRFNEIVPTDIGIKLTDFATLNGYRLIIRDESQPIRSPNPTQEQIDEMIAHLPDPEKDERKEIFIPGPAHIPGPHRFVKGWRPDPGNSEKAIPFWKNSTIEDVYE